MKITLGKGAPAVSSAELLFENGYSVIEWNDKLSTVIDRFTGSCFRYYRPVDDVERLEWQEDGMHVIKTDDSMETVSWL